MKFLYKVCLLIPENIKTKSLLKTNYNKMRVSLGSLWHNGMQLDTLMYLSNCTDTIGHTSCAC